MTCTISGNLDSAIYNDDVDFLLNNDNFICARHIKIKSFLNKKYKKISNYYSSECKNSGCIKNTIYSCSNDNQEKIKKYHKLAGEVALTLLEVEKSHYLKLNPTDAIDERIRKSFDALTSDPTYLSHLRFKLNCDLLKDKFINSLTSLGSFIKVLDEILVEKEVCIYICKRHGPQLLPTPYLLSILDMLQVRHSYLLFAKLFTRGEDSTFYQTLTRLITYLDNLKLQIGESFYDIMKNWEGLVIGFIVKDGRADLGIPDLYNECSSTIRGVLGRSSDLLLELFLQGGIRSPKSYERILMLSQLCKSFGHPFLNATSGIGRLRKIAKEKKSIDKEVAELTLAMFNKKFCKEYYKKHRKWPSLTKFSDIHVTIARSIESGTWLTRTELRNLPLSSWLGIRLEKNFDYDYSLDVTELLKDSSLAPPRKLWFTAYDPCAFKILHNQDKPKTGHKYESRVIIRYLKGRPNELRDKIEDQMNYNYNHDRDDIAQLCRKEKELNRDGGRVFCKQCYEQRLLQTSLENNVTKHIFPYMSDQTMSKSELELSKRKQTILRDQHSGKAIIINVDLSKWNMHQRHELNRHIFQAIDDLLGVNNMYSDSHRWFSRVISIVNSRLFPPKISGNGLPEEGEYCHYLQEGGFEGMRQKGWTITTMMLLYIALEQNDLEGDLLAQGDNQVIILRLTEDQIEDEKGIVRRLLNTCDYLFSSVGLKLKTEETWASKVLFEYSKIRYINGIPVNQGLKRLNRLQPECNEGFPSLNSMLTTTSTNTETIAGSMETPDIAFLICCYQYVLILLRHGVIQKEHRSAPLIIKSILLVPNLLGGFQVSNYLQHSMRGTEDGLTYWISLHSYIMRTRPALYKMILRVMFFTVRKNKNYRGLIEDISSLNIVQLPSFETEMREIVNQFLPRIVTNKEVLQYLDPTDTVLDSLVNTLCSMRPLVLPIAHQILKDSNPGIKLSMISKFQRIQTINHMINEEVEDMNIFSMGKLKDKDSVNEIKNRISNKRCEEEPAPTLYSHLLDKIDCSTVIAQKLRVETWGLPIIGVTHPFVGEQIKIRDYDSDGNNSNCIKTFLSHMLCKTPSVARKKLGPYPSYLGSSTMEKVSKPLLTVINPTPYIKSIKRLYVLYTWLKKSSGDENALLQLITQLINEKLVYLDEEFTNHELKSWCGSNYGGTLLHRFKSQIENRDSLSNTSHVVSTHHRTITDDFNPTGRREDDLTICFQKVFLYIANFISEMATIGLLLPRTLAIELDCENCTEVIPEFEIVLNENSYKSVKPISLGHPILGMNEALINEEEMIISLSLNLGRKISLTLGDCRSYLDYLDNEEDSSGNRMNSQYVTEIKGCEFEILIVGMLQGSKELYIDIFFPDTEGPNGASIIILSHLAYLLVTSNLLDSFVRFLKTKMTFHSQATNLKPLTEFLLTAIKRYVSLQRKWYLLIVGLLFLQDDNESFRQYLWCKTRSCLSRDKDNTNRNYDRRIQLLCNSKYSISEMEEKASRLIGVSKGSTAEISIPIDSQNVFLKWRCSGRPSRNVILPFSTYYIKDTILYPRELETDSVVQILRYYNNLRKNNILRINSVPICEEYGQDPIYFKEITHLNRQLGSISSTSSKVASLLSIKIDKWVLPLKEFSDGLIVSIAEGSGGLMCFLAHLFPDFMLIFNTLQCDTVEMKDNPNNVFPPAFVGDPCFGKESFVGLNETCIGETDIDSPKFFSKLVGLVKNKTIRILTMDAEHKTQDSNLTKTLKYLAMFLDFSDVGSILISKLFLNPDTRTHLLDIAGIYPEVNIYLDKPPNSHPLNREIYAVIQRNEDGLGKFETSKSFDNLELRVLQESTFGKEGRYEYIKNLLAYCTPNLMKCIFRNHCLNLGQHVLMSSSLSESFYLADFSMNGAHNLLIKLLFSKGDTRHKKDGKLFTINSFSRNIVTKYILILVSLLSKEKGLDWLVEMWEYMSRCKLILDNSVSVDHRVTYKFRWFLHESDSSLNASTVLDEYGPNIKSYYRLFGFFQSTDLEFSVEKIYLGKMKNTFVRNCLYSDLKKLRNLLQGRN